MRSEVKDLFDKIIRIRYRHACEAREFESFCTCGIDVSKAEGLAKVLTAIEISKRHQ